MACNAIVRLPPEREWEVKITRTTMKKTIALSAISAMALTGYAYSEIEADFHVGYNSTYVWRGQDLGDSAYEYGFDLAGSCECGIDWSAGIWYINPSDNQFNDELNIYGQVSKDFGLFSVALGFIHYEFDDTVDADNTEAYVSLGTSYSGIDFGGTFYQVVDGDLADNPSWAEFSASYSYEYSDSLGMTFGVTYGFTVDPGVDSYSTLGLRLSADYAASEDITISPYVAFNSANNFNTNSLGVDDFDGIYGGVLFAFNF